MTLYPPTTLPHLIDPENRFGPILFPVLQSMGYRLIRVGFGGADPKRGAILQVMIEPENGGRLSLEDCKNASRELSAHLDVTDPIADSYVLEVGSAGLDRPLTDKRDFERFKGWEARVESKRADENGQRRYRGILGPLHEEGFTLAVEGKGDIAFEWNNLSLARLIASDLLLKALQSGSV